MKVIRILLTAYLAWYIIKGIELMARSSSVDRIVYNRAGLSALFFALVIATIALYTFAIRYIWRPSRMGFRFSLLGLLLAFSETAIAGVIGYQNPSIIKNAFVASRIARGLVVKPEVLQLLDKPASHLVGIAFSFLFAVVIAVLLYVSVERSQTNGLKAAA